jgi:hypothetical protein
MVEITLESLQFYDKRRLENAGTYHKQGKCEEKQF